MNLTGDNMSTTGINPSEGDFLDVAPKKQSQKTASQGNLNSSNTGLGQALDRVPLVINTLEDRFPFTALVLSIVGYVIIAALGEMNSVGKYLGYLFFLFMVLAVYEVLKLFMKLTEKDTVKDTARLCKILIVVLALITIVLVSYVVYSNFQYLREKATEISQILFAEPVASSTPISHDKNL